MQKKFLYRDSNIVYRIEGDGANVVLLHGFGEDSRIWDHQVEFLKNHCRLIVPDLPGSGGSPFNKNLVSIEDYADAVYELLLHENISECILSGHSMGGYITLAFAEKYPQLLKGFGLVHSTAFEDSPEKKELRKKAVETIGQYGAYPFLKNTIPGLFGLEFKQNYPGKVNELVERSKEFSKEALKQYYTAMMNRPRRINVLEESKLPVLFVTGTEDTAAPVNDVLKQVHLPKIAYIHILKNCGHMGMWEEKYLMNKYLLEFILAGDSLG